MRPGWLLALPLALLAPLPSWCDETAARNGELLDRGRDVVTRRTFVPSEERRHGEVRLLRRDEAIVVQTLLQSKYLDRVLGRILGKERENWPKQAEGQADSQTYRDVLVEIARETARRREETAGDEDRKQALLIEFILSATAALVTIEEPEISAGIDDGTISRTRALALLEPSRGYVAENMALILVDSFGIPIEDARRMVDPGGEGEASPVD